ncbi:hypothetical protein M5689_024334 [Euphorbia peplus]|nr:hypothetical protein M5689_024334 [Euphorbia peplus]
MVTDPNAAPIQESNSEINGPSNTVKHPGETTLYGPSMMAPRRQYKPREKQATTIEVNTSKALSTIKAPIVEKVAPIFTSTVQGNGGDALFAATVPGGTSKGSSGSSRGGFSYVQAKGRGGRTSKGRGKALVQPLRDITNQNPFGVLEMDVPEQYMSSTLLENFSNTILDPGDNHNRGKRSRVGVSISSQNAPPMCNNGGPTVGGNSTDPNPNDCAINVMQELNDTTKDVSMESDVEGSSNIGNASHGI